MAAGYLDIDLVSQRLTHQDGALTLVVLHGAERENLRQGRIMVHLCTRLGEYQMPLSPPADRNDRVSADEVQDRSIPRSFLRKNPGEESELG